MRLCSRNRPTMLRTRILSDKPGTPGRNIQTPRTTRSIETPAAEASYSFSMIKGSARRFSFAFDQPGQLRPEVNRRHQQLSVIPLLRIPGQIVKELTGIGANFRVRGE